MVVKILSSKFQAARIIKGAPLDSESVKIGHSEAPTETQIRRQAEAQEAERQAQYQQVLQEAERQAEALMSEARHESVRLLNEAQQKVKQIEQQAYQEGFRKGEHEGQQALHKALEQFQQVMLAAMNERERLLAGCEQEAVHLVLEIVRKILKVEPLINEQVLLRVVRAALERLGKQMDVHIYIHPEDIELLHFSLSQIQDLALEIVIEPDPDMAPGGCRIRSRTGEIDATLQNQFEAIARPFLAVAEGTDDGLQWISGSAEASPAPDPSPAEGTKP